jgi:hypothetical protein
MFKARVCQVNNVYAYYINHEGYRGGTCRGAEKLPFWVNQDDYEALLRGEIVEVELTEDELAPIL